MGGTSANDAVATMNDANDAAPRRTAVEKRAHLEALDGMRGVAAAMVVVHHIAGLLHIRNLVPRGYLAVDFFFLLSGLVLTYAYGHRLRDGTLSVPRFAVLRVIRLYPMIVGGMVLGAAMAVFTFRYARPDLGDAAIAFVLGSLGLPTTFRSSLPPELFPLDGPLWSISFELLASAAFMLYARTHRMALLSGVTMVVGLLALFVLARVEHELSVGSRLGDWPWGLARVGFAFFAGVLLYRHRERLALVSPSVAAIVACAAFLFPRMSAHNVVVDLFAVVVVFPVAIASLSVARPTAFLARACRISGEISYPLYAIHYPFALALGTIAFLQQAPWTLRVGATFAASLALTVFGYAAFVLYDRPLRERLSRRRNAASLAASGRTPA